MVGARLQFVHDAEIDAEEAPAEFGDQFFAHPFAAILAIATEIAADAMRRSRPVRGLMAERCHVGCRIPEASDERHLDMIGRRKAEEGSVASMTDMRAGVPEKPIGMLDPLDGIGDRCSALMVAVRLRSRNDSATQPDATAPNTATQNRWSKLKNG